MNEPETQPAPVPEQQGIPIAKLLEIIGKQQVEWLVNEEAVVKLKDQATVIFKQNQSLTATVASLNEQIGSLKAEPAKPVAIPADLAKLQAVNNSKDEEIHLLEKQVHEVAVARDAAKVQAQAALLDLKNVQARCDDLQKKVDSVPVLTVPIAKGKKK